MKNTACFALCLLILCHQGVRAAAIPVPNGDFSSATNTGVVGGGLIGASGSNVAIGSSGPWVGTYSGLAFLLAPPTLTIGSSTATIGSLAGSGVVTPLDNAGFFSQTLTNTYAGQTMYSLSVDITSSQLISLSMLTTANAGIALTGSSGVLAATNTVPSNQLSIAILSGNTSRVTLNFTTGLSAPAGNIGIQLFARPEGLTDASLAHTVSFNNVTLDALAVPEANSLSYVLLGGGALVGLVRFRRRMQ